MGESAGELFFLCVREPMRLRRRERRDFTVRVLRLKVEICSHWFPFCSRCKSISSVHLQNLFLDKYSLIQQFKVIHFNLTVTLSEWNCPPSSPSRSPFDSFLKTLIFSVRFHNFHLFLLKASMKSAQRFLYTFSIHDGMFHWTLKRNSNLYYSITTQTGQPPKLLKRVWAWNGVCLPELCCPSVHSSSIPAAANIFDGWRSFLTSVA